MKLNKFKIVSIAAVSSVLIFGGNLSAEAHEVQQQNKQEQSMAEQAEKLGDMFKSATQKMKKFHEENSKQFENKSDDKIKEEAGEKNSERLKNIWKNITNTRLGSQKSIDDMRNGMRGRPS